jgi:hypothetical protein
VAEARATSTVSMVPKASTEICPTKTGQANGAIWRALSASVGREFEAFAGFGLAGSPTPAAASPALPWAPRVAFKPAPCRVRAC